MKAQFGDRCVKLRVLGCSGGELPRHRTTCFLVDDALALDAGALTAEPRSLESLLRVDDIVLTHSHFDHVKDVPLLADLLVGRRAVRSASTPRLRCARTLRENIFNDELWPDFTRIPDARRPVLEIRTFRPGARSGPARYTVRPVPVEHPVESVGFVISDGKDAIADLGRHRPDRRVWAR